ncbi:MAG TPA: Asp-tRNA(Asn)/Glu-tRNA(Gln) amidotransferase subunit GatC [Alphaproteobacteria bacterium]|jgi:aspartyl-tRNA(Asn)/glutamyl-tRNA(Gln) amidotransferase subunit C|nr:Asp-tRNA(Asn)/Glu-tRNA(Gln) amidotransferase subunit GatC [Alphaproteobacteria bacterium]
MAKLTRQDVLHIAKLAKLSLTDDEVEKFTAQLSSILKYVDELNSVDTSEVDPTSQTTGLVNVFRDDEIKTDQILSQAEALSGTDETYNGYFRVPTILEGRTDK